MIEPGSLVATATANSTCLLEFARRKDVLVIELDRSFFQEMVEQALAETPNEACGVIAGKEGRPLRLYRMRNIDESPKTYQFDAAEQYRVTSEIEDEGLELWAIYHSHTHTKAFPSATDRARAHMKDPATDELVPWFPGTLYLIVSLAETEPLLRGFRFVEGEPVEEEMRIT
jgi:proteasome lid subunit RPN8/RPN11